jgi:hypothetical protein
MARIRSLKPEFFKHPGICELPIATRYFFAGLWCQADREGRIKDRPKVLKVEIAPWDDLDADNVLAQLAAAGFVVRYEVDGEGYISIPHFAKHQRPHPREAKSEIPPPPRSGTLRAVESNGVTRTAPEINGEARTAARTDPAVEVNGKVPCLGDLGLGDLGGKAGGGILVHETPPPPAVALLPEKQKPPNGPGDPLVDFLRGTWPALKNPDVLADTWRGKWRGIDLLAEAKAARAYELEVEKPHEEPARFLRGWMRRAAENPGQARPGARGGFLQEGTPAWDAAKRAADERAKRERERTQAMFAERDRIQRQGRE